MTEIAKSDQARFEWWIQTKWQVLPTDPRYLDLTEEQKDLMFEHYKLDNTDTVTHKAGEVNEEGAVIEPEHFDDPDFDKEWANFVNDSEDSTEESNGWEVL